MTGRKLLALPLAFTGGVILSFAGCTETNDSHCSAKGGDEYCQQKTGLAEGEVFCTDNCGGSYDFDGCLVAEEPPAEGCWLCEGAGSQNCGSVGDGDTTESETTADTDSTDGSETMDTSTTETGPECMASSECPTEMPLCEDGACVGCGEGSTVSCASEYPELPACDGGSGECKLCTVDDSTMCMGNTPVCEDFACVACDEHAQCPDSACNMATGACMPTDRVWWVDQGAEPPGDGSEAMPFNTVTEALAQIGDGEMGTINLNTDGLHLEQVAIDSGKIVALLHVSGGEIQAQAGATLSVSEGALVFTDRLKATGADTGLQCASSEVWINRGWFAQNDDGEILVVSGSVHISNSFVGSNLTDVAAVTVASGDVDIVYSTISGGGTNSPALGCVNGSGVTVRNSLLVSLQDGDEVSCVGATIDSSALEMSIAGNVALGAMPNAGWFADYAEGDFHLTPLAPLDIENAARWENGDPKADFDENPRPATDGASDFAGADIRLP